jgi:hypothetical protein
MRFFIDKSDFVGYVDISQNVEDKYIDAAMRLAQSMDIKPILCTTLYNEFYTQFDSGTLTYANAALLPYVKEAMIYATYYRFLSTAAQIKNTPFGLVKKLSEHSEPATRAELADMISNAQSAAGHFKGELMQYLKDNDLDSECRECGEDEGYGMFNITKI